MFAFSRPYMLGVKMPAAIVNHSPDEGLSLLNEYEGLDSCCQIMQLPPKSVPRFLGACDLGCINSSKIFHASRCADQIGEYLLSVAGDSNPREGTGAISTDVGFYWSAWIKTNFRRLLTGSSIQCCLQREIYRASTRAVGLNRFSLEASAASYLQALQNLALAMKFLILTRYGRLGASSRMRFYQYLPALAAAGIEVQWRRCFR